MPCLPWPGRPGRARDPASRRIVLFLPEAEARGMGPGIPFDSGVSDASGCQHAGPRRNRGTRLVLELCLVCALYSICTSHRCIIVYGATDDCSPGTRADSTSPTEHARCPNRVC